MMILICRSPAHTSKHDIVGMEFTKKTGIVTGITKNGASKGIFGVIDLDV